MLSPASHLSACFTDTIVPIQRVHKHSFFRPTAIPYCLQETGRQTGNITISTYTTPMRDGGIFLHSSLMHIQDGIWPPAPIYPLSLASACLSAALCAYMNAVCSDIHNIPIAITLHTPHRYSYMSPTCIYHRYTAWYTLEPV